MAGGGAMSDGGSGGFEIMVEPRNDQYDPDDDGWQDQVRTLYADLDASVGTIGRSRPVEGTKGGADQLILALGSAGVFTALVECLRVWLGRDRDRRIDVRWVDNGAERSVTLTGEAVDDETMREIARAAVAQVGGTPWPSGTEHS
jgi:hypothetical protein